MKGSSQEHFRMLGTSARGLTKREKKNNECKHYKKTGGMRTKMGNVQ